MIRFVQGRTERLIQSGLFLPYGNTVAAVLEHYPVFLLPKPTGFCSAIFAVICSVISKNFSFTTIDAFSSSSLVTRLTTDISTYRWHFMMLIPHGRSCSIYVCCICCWLYHGWPSHYYIIMPLLGIGLYFIVISRVIPIFKRWEVRRTQWIRWRKLAGIRVVKSFVNENFERQKLMGFRRAAWILHWQPRAHGSELSIYRLHIYVLFVFLLYFGSYLIVSSQGTAFGVGQLSSLITYGFMMLTSSAHDAFPLSLPWSSLARKKVFAASVRYSLQLPLLTAEESSDRGYRWIHWFWERWILYSGPEGRKPLSGVDHQLWWGHQSPSSVVPVLQESTLVQHIPRLYDVTAGSVSVGGHSVKDYDIDTLRGAVAMVLQKRSL